MSLLPSDESASPPLPGQEGIPDSVMKGLLAAGAAAFDLGAGSGEGALGSEEEVGEVIGPYQLLSLLGEGGFGSVWRAEQRVPILREVALKVIKPGMGSREVIARFEAERQALALMDHPHIAAVLDAGQAADGRPYFAMELVQGLPLTEYCDTRRMTLRERLEIFVPVCQAVQHAHQKGVLHRDLKPSNILVAEVDGRAVPKVIDFGIAKALQSDGAGAPGLTLLQTQGLAVIGTPMYMSPEQAGLAGQDVDSRSDIFSLGVVLYELLTGSTPLSQETLKNAAADEMLRLIREQEALSPQRRVQTLGAAAETVARQRQTEIRRLAAQVRGDLEWIVLRALEKDRERRYSSAAALAQDIQSHLRDEPVSAGPPSAGYRLGKLARRHRGPLIAAALVLASLISGLGFTIWQAVRATRAEALAEAHLARMEAEKLRADEQAARAESEAQIAQAVGRFLREDLLQQASSDKQAEQGFQPDPNLTVRQALDRAGSRIGDQFKDQPQVEAAIRHTIGLTYRHTGASALGVPHLKRALELFTQCYGPDHRETRLCQGNLAQLLQDSGRVEEAAATFQELKRFWQSSSESDQENAIDATSNLATTYLQSQRPDLALPLCEEALKSNREQRGPEHPETLTSMNNLAGALKELGRLDEALPLMQETLGLRTKVHGPEHPLTLSTSANLGLILCQKGDFKAAIPMLESNLARRHQILGEEHSDTLTSMNNLAFTLALQGQPEAALKLHEKVLAGRTRVLGPGHPETINSLNNLGSVLARLGRHGEAQKIYAQALQRTRSLRGPDHVETIQRMNVLAAAYWKGKDYAAAIPILEEALKTATQSLGPDHPETVLAEANLGVNYRESGRVEDGAKLLRSAAARLPRLPTAAAARLSWISAQAGR